MPLEDTWFYILLVMVGLLTIILIIQRLKIKRLRDLFDWQDDRGTKLAAEVASRDRQIEEKGTDIVTRDGCINGQLLNLKAKNEEITALQAAIKKLDDEIMDHKIHIEQLEINTIVFSHNCDMLQKSGDDHLQRALEWKAKYEEAQTELEKWTKRPRGAGGKYVKREAVAKPEYLPKPAPVQAIPEKPQPTKEPAPLFLLIYKKSNKISQGFWGESTPDNTKDFHADPATSSVSKYDEIRLGNGGVCQDGKGWEYLNVFWKWVPIDESSAMLEARHTLYRHIRQEVTP
jgi:hypothetical protein